MHIALCDDNRMFLSILSRSLNAEFNKRNINIEIHEYTKGDILIEHHRLKPFDAVFLDIDMPTTSGFDIAKELAEFNDSCQVIFVTAHSELVYDSFIFRPLNFISKTDEKGFSERLTTVVSQLLEHFKQESSVVLKSTDGTQMVVKLKDILYIASRGHSVAYYIMTAEAPVIVRGGIAEAEESYSNNNFARIHKKYIVNLRHVIKIDTGRNLVIFKHHFELPFSRSYKQSFEDKLTSYLRRI